jgi:predicted RNA binding protein YcfA (HicA-like mRNA interferase family)
MPRVPRDISGQTLVKLLSRYGYKITRQTGSHIRLTSHVHGKEHHVTVPNHDYIKIGTLNSILNDLVQFLGKSKEEIVKDLF